MVQLSKHLSEVGCDLLGRPWGQTLSWPGLRIAWQRRSRQSGVGPILIPPPWPENKYININNAL